MQNSANTAYLNKDKVINIFSERLFREAEDDFYYFNKINSAYRKLQQAVALTPNHLKSIMLLADITFMKGYIKKALKLYFRAAELNKNNFKILASIANCYKVLGDYGNAEKYCDFAFTDCRIEDNNLAEQLTEIKVEMLAAQKKYYEAYALIKQKNKKFDFDYELLHNKIKLHKKLLSSKIKLYK